MSPLIQKKFIIQLNQKAVLYLMKYGRFLKLTGDLEKNVKVKILKKILLLLIN